MKSERANARKTLEISDSLHQLGCQIVGIVRVGSLQTGGSTVPNAPLCRLADPVLSILEDPLYSQLIWSWWNHLFRQESHWGITLRIRSPLESTLRDPPPYGVFPCSKCIANRPLRALQGPFISVLRHQCRNFTGEVVLALPREW